MQNINDEEFKKVYGLQKVDDFKKLDENMGLLILGVDVNNLGLKLDDQQEK